MARASRLIDVSVAAARLVLAETAVRGPNDIDVEAICARFGAMVEYGPLRTAAASIVRTAENAVIRVDETQRDEPRGRWGSAHELAHHRLHPLVDHFRQCTGSKESERRDWRSKRIEREADHFATELLMPEWLVQAYCNALRPTMDDLERVSRVFRMSLQASALRFVQLSPAPCAFVVSAGGCVKWSIESASFPVEIERGQVLDARSIAAQMERRAAKSDEPREVPGSAWGARGALVEHAIGMGGEYGVTSWIVGEGGGGRGGRAAEGAEGEYVAREASAAAVQGRVPPELG